MYSIAEGKISISQSPFQQEDASATVEAITEDHAGRLWIAQSGGGLWVLKDDQWRQYENAALPASPVRAEYTDAQGRIWFGYGGNVVAVLDNDKVQTFSRNDGLSVGVVKVIRGRDNDVWIGGDFGLAFLDQGRFQMLGADGATPLSGIPGIAERADGSLWLSESRGVLHIPATEVQKARRDLTYKVHYRLFDFADGLPGTIQEVNMPTAIEGTDGRLWFATADGLVWVDPNRLRKNLLPPPVRVSSVRVNGKTYSDLRSLRLAAGTTNLQIEYTALSLTVPERVQFRYKLDGVDRNWQDSGTRREAFYTNLGPGQYRFHVIAANNDGVWNEQGASLEFNILPTFYQTNWFYLLCLAVLVCLAWVLYRWRLHRIATRMDAQFAARLSERTRIARELHDTLLQSFQGLLLRFQAVSNLLPMRPEDAKERLDGAIDYAAKAITEGRDAVQQLRSRQVIASGLASEIRILADELSADHEGDSCPEFAVRVEGRPRSLQPIVRDEVYRIAGEALRNAFTHSRARRAEVEIRYGERELRLRIRDDGTGIDPTIAIVAPPKGHWGLSGMRERAELLGGRLEVWSEVDSGTEVELVVPAAVAYNQLEAWYRKLFAFRKAV